MRKAMLFFLGLLMLFVVGENVRAVSVVYPVGNVTTFDDVLNLQYVNGSGDVSLFVDGRRVTFLHGGSGSLRVPLHDGSNYLQLRKGDVPIWHAVVVRKLFSTTWIILSILWFISVLTAFLVKQGVIGFLSVVFASLMLLLSFSRFSAFISILLLFVSITFPANWGGFK